MFKVLITNLDYVFILGLGGISGSGKSTLAKILHARIPNSVIINFDNYYKHRPDLSFEQRQIVNYDHPDSLEIDRLLNDIKKLLKGESIQIPVYDFSEHLRTDQTILIEPPSLLIVEGIFTTVISEVRALMDLIIYVDVDIETAVVRRVRRDIIERGRETLQICDQLEATVIPGSKYEIAPSKRNADFIIRGDRPYEKIVEFILKMIENL